MNTKPLDRAFNVAVNHIASRLFPTGYDVADEAPSTLEELTDHLSRTGRMLVWKGASDDTIFADPETNWAFRAWHDYHHAKHQLAFDRDGETEVAKHQMRDIMALYGTGEIAERFCRILHAEIVGMLDYQDMHGDFPADQRAFVEGYLANPHAAILRAA